MRAVRCAHPDAAAVTNLDGETVAALCPDCDTRLPAAWLTCEHPAPIDITSFADPPSTLWCSGCDVTYWQAQETG
jgi:hypothetical protein